MHNKNDIDREPNQRELGADNPKDVFPWDLCNPKAEL